MITTHLRANLEWIPKEVQLCSIVWCTKCAITDLDKCILKEVRCKMRGIFTWKFNFFYFYRKTTWLWPSTKCRDRKQRFWIGCFGRSLHFWALDCPHLQSQRLSKPRSVILFYKRTKHMQQRKGLAIAASNLGTTGFVIQKMQWFCDRSWCVCIIFVCSCLKISLLLSGINKDNVVQLNVYVYVLARKKFVNLVAPSVKIHNSEIVNKNGRNPKFRRV